MNNTEAKITMDLKFKNKNGDLSAKIKILHNGVHTIKKEIIDCPIQEVLFQMIAQSAKKNNVSHINFTKGFIENQFAAYMKKIDLKKQLSGDSSEQSPVEENFTSSEVATENSIKETNVVLKSFENQLLHHARFADYESMFHQGNLYQMEREYALENLGYEANSFDMQITMPDGEQDIILKTFEKFNEEEINFGSDALELKKYNNRFEFKKANYKLAINFK